MGFFVVADCDGFLDYPPVEGPFENEELAIERAWEKSNKSLMLLGKYLNSSSTFLNTFDELENTFYQLRKEENPFIPKPAIYMVLNEADLFKHPQ